MVVSWLRAVNGRTDAVCPPAWGRTAMGPSRGVSQGLARCPAARRWCWTELGQGGHGGGRVRRTQWRQKMGEPGRGLPLSGTPQSPHVKASTPGRRSHVLLTAHCSPVPAYAGALRFYPRVGAGRSQGLPAPGPQDPPPTTGTRGPPSVARSRRPSGRSAPASRGARGCRGNSV